MKNHKIWATALLCLTLLTAETAFSQVRVNVNVGGPYYPLWVWTAFLRTPPVLSSRSGVCSTTASVCGSTATPFLGSGLLDLQPMGSSVLGKWLLAILN